MEVLERIYIFVLLALGLPSHKMFDEKKYMREYYIRNRERLLMRSKENGRLNIEKKRQIARQWYEDNKENVKNDRSRRSKEWRLKNPERYKARQKTTVILRQRMIGGQKIAKHYRKELNEIYLKCPLGWHVDHIVPLRGKGINGLHVPWNLQYLPALVNMTKGNKMSGAIA